MQFKLIQRKSTESHELKKDTLIELKTLDSNCNKINK